MITLGRAQALRRLSDGSQLALTFDDGPDPQHTPPLLDLLAATNARATFFVLGERACAHRALIRRILSDGHTLGSHGWTHEHPWALSRAAAIAQVTRAANALDDLQGTAVQYFRPAFGRVRRCMIEAAALEGQRLALWSRSVVDWGPFGTVPAIQRRLSRARGGDIVLLHDAANKRNHPAATRAALAGALPFLAQRFTCVALQTSAPEFDHTS
jgi:peptidoglycan-N-acetylglucosamine deacetylase